MLRSNGSKRRLVRALKSVSRLRTRPAGLRTRAAARTLRGSAGWPRQTRGRACRRPGRGRGPRSAVAFFSLRSLARRRRRRQNSARRIGPSRNLKTANPYTPGCKNYKRITCGTFSAYVAVHEAFRSLLAANAAEWRTPVNKTHARGEALPLLGVASGPRAEARVGRDPYAYPEERDCRSEHRTSRIYRASFPSAVVLSEKCRQVVTKITIRTMWTRTSLVPTPLPPGSRATIRSYPSPGWLKPGLLISLSGLSRKRLGDRPIQRRSSLPMDGRHAILKTPFERCS